MARFRRPARNCVSNGSSVMVTTCLKRLGRPFVIRGSSFLPRSVAPILRSDKSSKGLGQDQIARIEEKLSDDVFTSTSKPQMPLSRLASQCDMKKTLDSQVSLLPCSTTIEIIKSDKADQDHTANDIHQEKLSSSIVTTRTSKPRTPSSIAKQLLSSSKMRFVHKHKAFQNNKAKKMSKHKPLSTT